jgi:hypothetical protein
MPKNRGNQKFSIFSLERTSSEITNHSFRANQRGSLGALKERGHSLRLAVTMQSNLLFPALQERRA